MFFGIDCCWCCCLSDVDKQLPYTPGCSFGKKNPKNSGINGGIRYQRHLEMASSRKGQKHHLSKQFEVSVQLTTTHCSRCQQGHAGLDLPHEAPSPSELGLCQHLLETDELVTNAALDAKSQTRDTRCKLLRQRVFGPALPSAKRFHPSTDGRVSRRRSQSPR